MDGPLVAEGESLVVDLVVPGVDVADFAAHCTFAFVPLLDRRKILAVVVTWMAAVLASALDLDVGYDAGTCARGKSLEVAEPLTEVFVMRTLVVDPRTIENCPLQEDVLLEV